MGSYKLEWHRATMLRFLVTHPSPNWSSLTLHIVHRKIGADVARSGDAWVCQAKFDILERLNTIECVSGDLMCILLRYRNVLKSQA